MRGKGSECKEHERKIDMSESAIEMAASEQVVLPVLTLETRCFSTSKRAEMISLSLHSANTRALLRNIAF